ncbi:MAG TPA: 4Fe-4S dicluster domain-containing protein, partial [Methylomirabilota bacterium]|nr:4Fe-4S dicluster domain-containing protein [Methylomirabilota bacterium]
PLFGGGTCAAGQATVLSLYDEDRLRGPLWFGQPTSWAEIDAWIAPRVAAALARAGGIALLSGPVLSPTTRELIAGWADRHPSFQHVVYEPRSLAAVRRAHEQAFGAAVVPHHRFDRARVIVGIEADFLGTWLSPVEFTHHYSRHRTPDAPGFVSLHVQYESGLSLTGANADRRVPITPSQRGLVALALLRALRLEAGLEPLVPPPPASAVDRRQIAATAHELWLARGESLLVSGAPEVSTQLLVAAANDLLGNVGQTLELDRPSLQSQADDVAMERLIRSMDRGDIHVLIVHGVNPAYDHPESARFLRALDKVALSVALADRLDETAVHVHAVCPDHHFLEAWNDAEPVASVYSLAQPTIAPLFDTRAAQESLVTWIDGPADEKVDYRAILRDHWRRNIHPRQMRYREFDELWDRTLQSGVLDLSATSAGEVASRSFAGDWLTAAGSALERCQKGQASQAARLHELHLYEAVGLRDGRQANNPWLQELPDPITKLTWGNCASVSPALASSHALADGDVVALVHGRTRLELPVLVQPGQQEHTISVPVGYGRTRGKVAGRLGINAYPMALLVDGLRGASRIGVRLEKTGRREALAATQTHHSMEGRPIVREATLAEYRQNPAAGNAERGEQATLWKGHPEADHLWGMAIDLSTCTGCSACVVACQAENNVPVVGKDEVRRGREMHWIRLDRYYAGGAENPDTVFQPMMCQHCNNAPCETVCPVLATVHSSDGLNQQIYNRCVGTRYCENNCPYKVRRFNWFNYAQNPRFDYDMNSALGTMVLNPDVVVRSRGVMEKCSLCVQRIQAAKLTAKQEGRPLADGDVRTACQQACPAQAIVFGDFKDPGSRLAHLRTDARHYHVLDELGTRPNVGYLTKIRNREEA